MTAMAYALRTALFDFLWQGLAVACILWMALYLLRRGRAQARYAVSCAALAVMMALPAVTTWRAFRAGFRLGHPRYTATQTVKSAAAQSAGPSWAERLEPWALPVWAAGVLLSLGWSGVAGAFRRCAAAPIRPTPKFLAPSRPSRPASVSPAP